jgi:hypothetical protein
MLGIETLFGTAFLGIFGSPIFMFIFLIAFFAVIMIFGRVGIIVATPIMISAMLLSFNFLPQFRIPFAIIFGIMLGIGFYHLYRGG